VILFFILYLIIGLLIFDDFGLSWDEEPRRDFAKYSLRYYLTGDEGLLQQTGVSTGGQVFGIFLILIEKMLGISSSLRSVYFMRHLLTFLLFFTGVIFFYLIIKKSFKSWKLGLLGSLFLIMSPRIFGESFYNPKDIPFMSVFIISIFTLILFLQEKTWSAGILHGLACAFLIDIRILGVLVPLLTVIFFIFDILAKKDTGMGPVKAFTSIAIYFSVTVSFTIFFWPYLWESPIKNFLEVFSIVSRFPWPGANLYLGEYVKATELPWHYIPVWLSITTPILYLLFFIIGFVHSIKKIFKKPLEYYRKNRETIIFISWLVLPITIVILFGSVVYNGWRHMYFVYPAFLLISLRGLVLLFRFIQERPGKLFRIILSSIIVAAILLSLSNSARFMIKYHPYQGTYFNKLAGKDMAEVKYNFDLEYWGTSYREALEYILENDERQKIKISYLNKPGRLNARILTPDQENRLKFVDKIENSHYFLSNYRYHREEYDFGEEFYSIKIDGEKILVVYKIR
jgi:hypothetical protein